MAKSFSILLKRLMINSFYITTLRLGSFSKICLELGIHYLWRLALSPSSDKDRDILLTVQRNMLVLTPFFYMLIERSADIV